MEMDNYKSDDVMICTGMTLNGSKELYIFSRGALISWRYKEEILELWESNFSGTIGFQFNFMANKSNPYRFQLVDECYKTEYIKRIEWPTRYLDLYPIVASAH
ncbi:hypothetical protein TNCV_1703481 [Trichonephila clavipes]|nr:hypothetical protein TNCV_1703481 [Trichonephila clavipes]